MESLLLAGACPADGSSRKKERIVYKQAEILFFDEATSALDHRTEQEINHALQELSHQRHELTIVIIAHRESSLAFCDRIFDLDSGNIYTKEK